MRLADRFSRNLRAARLQRQLSQRELASRAALSISYVSMLERGQRSPPLDTVEGLGKALGVAPAQILR